MTFDWGIKSIHVYSQTINMYITFLYSIYIHKHIYFYSICMYIYLYTHRSFSTTFDKGLRKNNNNKETEIGKQKLNEHWI